MAKSGASRSYKIDFFVVTNQNERVHPLMADFLDSALSGGYTEALKLSGDEERHQIRSLFKYGKSNVFAGVFGRCQYWEKPEQAKDDEAESDVELKPGHGLVQKNHFIFWAQRNLLLYQRNPSGSHSSRLQRYLSLATGDQLLLEPILTTDAYERLLSGGEARVVEFSFQQPKDASFYKDQWLKDAVKMLGKVGSVNASMRLSVGRTKQSLLNEAKNAVVALAKGGAARVARVRLEDEQEAIDLIHDRVVETVSVELNEKGRPEAQDLYAAIATAEIKRTDDLKTFFGH